MRETVQLGEMYLLGSVYDNDAPAIIYQFVSRDKEKSVVFVYSNNKGFMGWLNAIKLKGLKADKKYKISMRGVDSKKVEIPNTSGDTLMKMGLAFKSYRMLDEDSVYGCFAVVLE